MPPSLAALEHGYLVKIEDRWAVARLVAEVAVGRIECQPPRSSEGSFVGRDDGHEPSIRRLFEKQSRFRASSTMLAQPCLLTVREVALTLRQSERTVRDKIASGDIAAVRIGSGPRAPIRIPSSAFEAFIHTKGTSDG